MKKIKTKNRELECYVEFENDEIVILSPSIFAEKGVGRLTYGSLFQEAYYIEIDGVQYKIKWATKDAIAYEKNN